MSVHPPIAPVRPVTETHHGQTVTDPYRWMEDDTGPEMAAWLRAHADHGRALLDALPTRAEFHAHLDQVNNAVTTMRKVVQRGDRYVYLKRTPDSNDFALMLRDGLDGEERLLVDPAAVTDGAAHFSIAAFSVSHDGAYVSYLLSPGGGEFGTIYVIDAASGVTLPDRIEDTRWTAGEWLPDNRSFGYIYFPMLTTATDPTEKMQMLRVHRHTLGSDDDRALFGYGVSEAVDLDKTFIHLLSIPPASDYAYAVTLDGVSPNSAFYIAPIDALDQPEIPWRKVITMADQVSKIAIVGETLYALTFLEAPRYRLVATPLDAIDLAADRTLVPQGDAVLENFEAARDALYLQLLDGGTRRITRLPYDGGPAQPIALPDGASADLLPDYDPQRDGVLVRVNAWTRAQALYRCEASGMVDTGLFPAAPLDMSGIAVVSVRVPSHDGVLIPLVILHRHDLALDGSHPLLLEGYGSYGIEITSPLYEPIFYPWLDRGGILAFAGVRGGGEFGEAWHQAGRADTKPNTWLDFIACAEHLVRAGYTSPHHLAGTGTSAGGILINNAVVTRPDLFAAAICNVGMSDMLRYEFTQNGIFNIPEFGTITNPDGFRALVAMDAYRKVTDGVGYPAVMFTHGINDPRVDVWSSAKMAARLMAASASGKPVILRLDYDAGHFGATKAQANALWADKFAFLWEFLGGA